MHSHYTNVKDKERYNDIYQLAKAKNSQELAKRLNGLGMFVNNENKDRYHPITLLAKEGDVESVDFLMQFGLDRSYAVRGYAMGGHVAQVNEQIRLEASRNGNVARLRDEAVYGYATGGHVARVNEQIWLGAKPDLALNGYIWGGYFNQVDQLIKEIESRYRDYVNRDSLVSAYADAGHVEQVNLQIALLKQKADPTSLTKLYDSVASSYLESDKYSKPKLRQEEMLPLLASTDDAGLRMTLARMKALQEWSMSKCNQEFESSSYFKLYANQLLNAYHLNIGLRKNKFNFNVACSLDIMRSYKFDFDVAFSLWNGGISTWVLQGFGLINAKKISEDIFWKITTILLGCQTGYVTSLVLASDPRLQINKGPSKSTLEPYKTGTTLFKAKPDTDNPIKGYSYTIGDVCLILQSKKPESLDSSADEFTITRNGVEANKFTLNLGSSKPAIVGAMNDKNCQSLIKALESVEGYVKGKIIKVLREEFDKENSRKKKFVT